MLHISQALDASHLTAAAKRLAFVTLDMSPFASQTSSPNLGFAGALFDGVDGAVMVGNGLEERAGWLGLEGHVDKSMWIVETTGEEIPKSPSWSFLGGLEGRKKQANKV